MPATKKKVSYSFKSNQSENNNNIMCLVFQQPKKGTKEF
jgi:hypothetical protein